MNGGNFFSNDQKIADNYQTPGWLFNILNEKFKFSVDLACDSTNFKILGSPFFNEGFDALEADWSKWPGFKYVYPPFSKPFFAMFLRKAYEEYRKGQSSVVVVPLKTLTTDYAQNCRPPLVYIIYPRIRFLLNGQENHMGEAICLFVYNAEVKESIAPTIHFLDFNRYSPSTYRK